MCMYVVLCCLFKLSSEGFARTMMTYVRFILQASTVAITRSPIVRMPNHAWLKSDERLGTSSK
jgi:hypothetical protein